MAIKYKSLVHNGEVIPGYCVDGKGNIISTKFDKMKKLSPKVSGKSPYPTIGICHNGNKITATVHRLVCQSWHRLPKSYPGISARIWSETHVDVKKQLMIHMQVNHKDGNPKNYHPSNLEWTTGEQNRDHYYKVLRPKRRA